MTVKLDTTIIIPIRFSDTLSEECFDIVLYELLKSRLERIISSPDNWSYGQSVERGDIITLSLKIQKP